MRPLKEKTAAAIVFSLGALCAAALIVFMILAPTTGDAALDALVTAVVSRAIMTVFVFAVVLWQFRKALRFPLPSGRTALWLVPALAVAIVNFPFSALASGTGNVTRPDLLWLFIIKCALIGVSEEWLFRGILLSVLTERLKCGRKYLLSVLISSAVFAVFHFINLIEGGAIGPTLMQVGYSFLIGAMLAAVCLRTDNVWLCVFIHALFDVGGFLISDLGAGSPHDTVFWILTAVVGILTAVHITAYVLKLDKPATDNYTT